MSEYRLLPVLFKTYHHQLVPLFLQVNVYLSDDHCLLGFPLTRLPLANRSYIKTTGLRSTVAWAMASLAQIQVLTHLLYSLLCVRFCLWMQIRRHHQHF